MYTELYQTTFLEFPSKNSEILNVSGIYAETASLDHYWQPKILFKNNSSSSSTIPYFIVSKYAAFILYDDDGKEEIHFSMSDNIINNHMTFRHYISNYSNILYNLNGLWYISDNYIPDIPLNLNGKVLIGGQHLSITGAYVDVGTDAEYYVSDSNQPSLLSLENIKGSTRFYKVIHGDQYPGQSNRIGPYYLKANLEQFYFPVNPNPSSFYGIYKNAANNDTINIGSPAYKGFVPGDSREIFWIPNYYGYNLHDKIYHYFYNQYVKNYYAYTKVNSQLVRESKYDIVGNPSYGGGPVSPRTDMV